MLYDAVLPGVEPIVSAIGCHDCGAEIHLAENQDGLTRALSGTDAELRTFLSGYPSAAGHLLLDCRLRLVRPVLIINSSGTDEARALEGEVRKRLREPALPD